MFATREVRHSKTWRTRKKSDTLVGTTNCSMPGRSTVNGESAALIIATARVSPLLCFPGETDARIYFDCSVVWRISVRLTSTIALKNGGAGKSQHYRLVSHRCSNCFSYLKMRSSFILQANPLRWMLSGSRNRMNWEWGTALSFTSSTYEKRVLLAPWVRRKGHKTTGFLSYFHIELTEADHFTLWAGRVLLLCKCALECKQSEEIRIVILDFLVRSWGYRA